jgi:hypothetical protein
MMSDALVPQREDPTKAAKKPKIDESNFDDLPF